MDLETDGIGLPHCPNCGSPNTRRSMRRGLREGAVLRVEHMAPFRCRACRHRFVAEWSGWPKGEVRPRQSLLTFLGLRKRGNHESSAAAWLSMTLAAALITILVFGILLANSEKAESVAHWMAPANIFRLQGSN